MNKPLSCGAQDMLEAAIVQKRRINLIINNENDELSKFPKVLPIDIGMHKGLEMMTFLTSDNMGGIIKLSVNTADVMSFETDDFKNPRIHFNKEEESTCKSPVK